ncbi:MAG: carboxypeptidase M32 [Gammaproteobacteria bacterium]|nr:carboxypeptidase M32 [Gammaproteobacteria bacterium]
MKSASQLNPKQSAYTQLENLFNQIHQLHHLAAIAHWDAATMMPPGGSEARGQALAEISSLINRKISDHKVGELIQQARQQHNDLSDWQQANLREIQQKWLNATSITDELVKAKAIAGSKCEHAWRTYRQENNWTAFKPLLEEVVQLTREESQMRGDAMDLPAYDALLNLYEPGQSSAQIDLIFKQLTDFLPTFIQQVVEKQAGETVISPQGKFPLEQQKALALELMHQVGFNFEQGRLDISHHPFCGGVAEDVRITTRYQEHDFSESLMGVLHETGHAKYEQGLPKEWLNQPVGEARSMGIHESQSLFQEMQIARSEAFFKFAAPVLEKFLGNSETAAQCWQAENLFQLTNRVKPGYIRINADEVTYPLHIILRYEIEKDLINGQLNVADLPGIWDQKMQTYLGLSSKDNYRDGCMQDIHWTDGSLGYFPTYTLGAMNAAQLFHAARQVIPALEQQISLGDFSQLNQWQRDNIWSKGSFYRVNDLMRHATDEALNPDYFIKHLKQRFLS